MTQDRTGIGSLANTCGHLASICGVTAYCMTDMLELRSLALCATMLGTVFQYYRPVPLWLPIKWNVVFLGINGYMVATLLSDQYAAQNMPQEMKELYESGDFDARGYSKTKFTKFFGMGTKREFSKERICQEGKTMDKL